MEIDYLFVGTIVVLSALLPTSDAGVLESPFVAVLEQIGVPYAADIMNFVILTAILSAQTQVFMPLQECFGH